MPEEHGGSNFTWFLLGAGLGATAALLLAPQTGDETRRFVRDKAEEGRENFSRSGREAYERGRELYERGRGLADDAAKAFRRREREASGTEPGQEPPPVEETHTNA